MKEYLVDAIIGIVSGAVMFLMCAGFSWWLLLEWF